MFPELLKLPVAIQLGLASGYAGYHFAYVGIREHHKAIDIAFITLVFGLVATVIFSLIVAGETHFQIDGIFGSIFAGIFAFAGSIGAGTLWRKTGRNWLHKDLRKNDLSWANDDLSAFRTITTCTKYSYTQVGVELVDGTWLLCDDTTKFEDAPHGPLALGPNGDIGFYWTHQQKPKDRKPKESVNGRNAVWGDCMTYIPPNQIRRITLRLKLRN